MMNPMPERLFLNKPAPLLPQVTEVLARGWTGGLQDLSGTLVVLPTKGARRRLHESLAMMAVQMDAGHDHTDFHGRPPPLKQEALSRRCRDHPL